MTNAQIIYNEQERLFSEGKILKNKAGEYEPMHTFAIWKKLGYSVKKGQHAVTTLYIWKSTTKNTKKDIEDNKDNKDNKDKKEKAQPEFVKTKAFFFKASQVEKIDAKNSKKATTEKATTKKTTTKKATTKKTTTKKATTEKTTTKKDKKVEEYEQITLCDEIIKDINRYAR